MKRPSRLQSRSQLKSSPHSSDLRAPRKCGWASIFGVAGAGSAKGAADGEDVLPGDAAATLLPVTRRGKEGGDGCSSVDLGGAGITGVPAVEAD
jgi:hypothetical protein